MVNTTTPFTQDDLNDWLACSKEAGRRVWFISGLYTNMQYYATKQALTLFGYHELQKQLTHEAIAPHQAASYETEEEIEELSEETMGEPSPPNRPFQKSLLVETLNELASDVILEYHAWMKEKKTPADFAALGIGGFLNYTKVTLRHRLCDRISTELKIERREDVTLGDRPSAGDEDLTEATAVSDLLELRTEIPGRSDSAQAKLLADRSMGQEARIVLREFQERCREVIQHILAAFSASSHFRQAASLRSRLELLSQLPESESWEILAFLTDNYRHLDYKNFAANRMGGTFNQNKWNSYNRRLRQKLMEFLTTYPDQEQIAQLQECVQCLMEAQNL